MTTTTQAAGLPGGTPEADPRALFGPAILAAATIRKGAERQRVRGEGRRRMRHDVPTRLRALSKSGLSRITPEGARGGRVRALAPIPPPDPVQGPVAEAGARLRRLLRGPVDRLPRFIPE